MVDHSFISVTKDKYCIKVFPKAYKNKFSVEIIMFQNQLMQKPRKQSDKKCKTANKPKIISIYLDIWDTLLFMGT